MDACKQAFLARKVEGGFHLLRPDGTPLNDQACGHAKVTCGQSRPLLSPRTADPPFSTPWGWCRHHR
jgi:hypothetical protein